MGGAARCRPRPLTRRALTAVRLARYEEGSSSSVGLLVGSALLDVNRLQRARNAGPGPAARVSDIEGLLRDDALLEWVRRLHAEARRSGAVSASKLAAATSAPWVECPELRFLSPVSRPTKVIGVGMNYRTFVHQLHEIMPRFPALFHKTASALTGHQATVVLPDITNQAVPEGEVALLIGTRAHALAPGTGLAHVAGLTIANDISARNLEFQTTQWTGGKMLPTFCPLGPVVVTPDELDHALDLQVITRLNGEVVQHGHARDMVFDFDELVVAVSARVVLEIGDVLLTGTPSDLGEVDPPVYLRANDVVSVEVPGIGTLTNTVQRASAFEFRA